MLFHRRQDAQIALDTSCVVIANILLDHLNKLVLADGVYPEFCVNVLRECKQQKLV